MLHQYRREPNAVAKRLDELVVVCAEHGILHYEGSAAILRGWTDVTRGMVEQGLAELRRGLAIHERSPVGLRKAYYAALLVEAHLHRGDFESGLAQIDESLARVQTLETTTGVLNCFASEVNCSPLFRPETGSLPRRRFRKRWPALGNRIAGCSNCVPPYHLAVFGRRTVNPKEPMDCSRRSTPSSPRASIPPTSRTPKPSWTNSDGDEVDAQTWWLTYSGALSPIRSKSSVGRPLLALLGNRARFGRRPPRAPKPTFEQEFQDKLTGRFFVAIASPVELSLRLGGAGGM